MSAVNELVVREYFESQGYLVSQPRKYSVPGRTKLADEELDLIVFNPQITEDRYPDHVVWANEDLRYVSRAIVGVRGWHTGRFSVTTFEQTPDILRFVEADSIRFAAKLLGSTKMARILCLPRLPASGDLKDKTIQVLKEKGIDGVISFHTILVELVKQVDINKNYEKSDLLQIIRLMKNYELIKDSQLEMFFKPHRRARVAKASPKEDTTPKTE